MVSPSKDILLASALSIGYPNSGIGETLIASTIDLCLSPGKIHTLVGANGIGKSTLLRTLAGIQPPLSGSVLLQGKNLGQYTALELAQQLSLVLTEKLPPSNLTVFELIALGRQPYTNWLGALTQADREKIQRAISLTEIGDLTTRKHDQISDGQLQRVLIARALAQDTPLIILDEPTTHLDLLHKVSVFRLLKKLAGETGKCILFSTHDVELAIQLSDEMIVMTVGQTIQGTPCQLIEKGVFDQLFQDPAIRFDRQKGKFTID